MDYALTIDPRREQAFRIGMRGAIGWHCCLSMIIRENRRQFRDMPNALRENRKECLQDPPRQQQYRSCRLHPIARWKRHAIWPPTSCLILDLEDSVADLKWWRVMHRAAIRGQGVSKKRDVLARTND